MRDPRKRSGPNAAAAFDTALALERQREQLVETARRAVGQSRELREAVLRPHVEEYTRRLRTAGEPPERVLVLIKAAVSSMLDSSHENRQEFMADVVLWCVEAYYAA